MESVTLEPADYWKLMKLGVDLDLATTQARAIVGTAKAARDAFAKEISAKHPDFKVEDAHYRADDATFTLIRER